MDRDFTPPIVVTQREEKEDTNLELPASITMTQLGEEEVEIGLPASTVMNEQEFHNPY